MISDNCSYSKSSFRKKNDKKSRNILIEEFMTEFIELTTNELQALLDNKNTKIIDVRPMDGN